MICRHCGKYTDDTIVMQLMRFKKGELYSYANQPVVLCLDCYDKIRMTNEWPEEKEEK